MRLNQNVLRFTLSTLLLCCAFSIVAEAQRRRTRTAQCTPGTWVYRMANLGQPAPTVNISQGGVIVQVTDGDGNLDSRGGYFKVTNNGNETIEFQPGNTDSVWYPVEPGQSDMEGISQYRGVRDNSPTRYSVKIRYKCGTLAAQQPQQNNQANNQSQANAQAQQQQSHQQQPVNRQTQPPVNQPLVQKNPWMNQPFPIGCWKFTSVDYPRRTFLEIFMPDGSIYEAALTDSDGKDIAGLSYNYGSGVNKWKMVGNEIIRMRADDNWEHGKYRFDGSRLRYWSDMETDYSDKMLHDTGVKDDTCTGYKKP